MATTLAKERPIIRCYNKPGIPVDLQARYTAEGLFVTHYENVWSLESSDVTSKKHRSAAGRAFNRIITITQTGGLGLIRTPNDDDKLLTVGEWHPNCATFREPDGIKLKGVQMARYGLLIPQDDHYDQLDTAYDKSGATVDDVRDHKDLITDALTHLEHEGRLRTPTYR